MEDNFSTDRVVGGGSGGNVSNEERQMKLRSLVHRSPPAVRYRSAARVLRTPALKHPSNLTSCLWGKLTSSSKNPLPLPQNLLCRSVLFCISRLSVWKTGTKDMRLEIRTQTEVRQISSHTSEVTKTKVKIKFTMAIIQ